MAKNVELLLTENVETLGIVGDVVTVKPGYARNFLLPRGLAVKPTQRAKEALAERRAQVERELAALRGEMEQLIEKLEGFEITLERSCNDQGHLYGSVTQHDIAVALQEAGFTHVTDRHVRIGIAIKRIDSYSIPVQLDQDLKTEIKLWVVADRELNLDDREDMEFDDEGELIEKPAAAEEKPAEATAQSESAPA